MANRQINEMHLSFPSLSANESFARSVAAAFCAQLNPTIEELSDIRTSVSEAVTNAIIHGYGNGPGTVEMTCRIEDAKLTITVTDRGCGIADIERARQPFFTSRPELERSGMGFTVMEAFMDEVNVESTVGGGTSVTLIKTIGRETAE